MAAGEVSVVVNSYLEDENKTENHIYTLLKCIQENQCLRDHEWCKEWTAKVNSLLSSKTDRWLGITLLGTAIQQCDTETFTVNCMTWMNAVLQVIQSSSSSVSLIKCSVMLMDELIKYAVQFPDVSRAIGSSVLPSLITALLSQKDKDVTSTLSGICTCLRYMPGPSTPFRGQIENCIIPCLDSWNINIRKKTCLCFSLLAACRSSPLSADKSKTSWEIQWNRILVTLNDTLNNLYENIELPDSTPNVDLSLGKTEMLAVSSVTDKEPLRTNTLATRLISLIDCLSTMTREGFHKGAAIPINETLGTTERILAVDKFILRGFSVDVAILKTCLPVIHESAVELLYSLIQRCGSLLLPNSSRVANLWINELSMTLDNQSDNTSQGQHKAYSNIRCKLYKCFINWMHLNASISTEVTKKVIHNILSDIKPQTKQTKLVTTVKIQQNSTKKGKKRKLEEMKQLSTSQKEENPLTNLSVGHTALSALYALLMNGVTNINKGVYQEIQDVLLDLILQSQVSSPERIPLPYSDPNCRKELYRCMLACILAHPPQTRASIQCAIRCFTRGLQDTHYKVTSYCREALTISSAIIHPLVPSLESAVQLITLPTKSATSINENADQHQLTHASSTCTVDVPAEHHMTKDNDFNNQLKSIPGSFEVLPVPNSNGLLDKGKDSEQITTDSGDFTPITIGETHVRLTVSDHEKINLKFTTDSQQNTLTHKNKDYHAKESMYSSAIESTRHLDINSSLKDLAPTDASNTDQDYANSITSSCLPKTDALTVVTGMNSAEMHKLDNEEIDKKSNKVHKARNNENAKQDLENVDEMLASFVNSSPDSDTE